MGQSQATKRIGSSAGSALLQEMPVPALQAQNSEARPLDREIGRLELCRLYFFAEDFCKNARFLECLFFVSTCFYFNVVVFSFVLV